MVDKSVREIAEILLEITGEKLVYSEVKELFDDIEMKESDDFTIDFAGGEFRIIDEDSIFDIYVDEIEELTKDCYLGGGDLPSWVAIDWETTAKNVLDYDGYGHHFASWDGEEHETRSTGYYIFRIG